MFGVRGDQGERNRPSSSSCSWPYLLMSSGSEVRESEEERSKVRLQAESRFSKPEGVPCVGNGSGRGYGGRTSERDKAREDVSKWVK